MKTIIQECLEAAQTIELLKEISRRAFFACRDCAKRRRLLFVSRIGNGRCIFCGCFPADLYAAEQSPMIDRTGK